MENIHCYMICNYFIADKYILSYDDKIIDEKYEEILDIVKPDIVHINHLMGLSFGIIGKTKCRGIPLVITLHDFWFVCTGVRMIKNDKICINRNDINCVECVKTIGFNPVLPQDITRRYEYAFSSLEKADVIISPSLFLKNLVLSQAGIKNEILCIPNGITGNRIKKKMAKGKKIIFGYCGTISQTKGVHLILEAFEKIRREKKDAVIYIRGNITARVYEKYLDDNFPRWRKYYKGPYEPDTVYDIMSKKISVLVVPSVWHENYPTVINEAFLSGIPVIGSNLGGIPEMIDDNETGLLFDPFNENGLLNKMISLADNPDRIEYMKKNVANKKIKSMKEHSFEMQEMYFKLNNSKTCK